MPIYEYQLPSGQVIERIRSMKDRDEPLPEHPGAELVASLPYFRPDTLYGINPHNGKRMVVNDYDDPWEGTKGAGWAQEASKEYSAKVDKARHEAGVGPEREAKTLTFDQRQSGAA